LIHCAHQQSSQTQAFPAAIENASSISAKVLPVNCDWDGTDVEGVLEICALIDIQEALDLEES
jgi:hypothetical protein